jgi:hypothetical protein
MKAKVKGDISPGELCEVKRKRRVAVKIRRKAIKSGVYRQLKRRLDEQQ